MTRYIVTYVDISNTSSCEPTPFAFGETFETRAAAMEAILSDAEDCKDSDEDIFDENKLVLTYAEDPDRYCVWNIQEITIN